MNLTRRGWGVVAVVAFALVMASTYGSRALDGLVVPLAVVLVGAVVSVARTDRPRVERRPIEAGFPGDRRTVAVTIDADSPTAATVRDASTDGLLASDAATETTIDEGTRYEYEVRLAGRGSYRVGPVSIAVTDVLGLVETRFEYGRTTPVLVYPRVYDLRGGAGHDLRLFADEVREDDREEFDFLREYERGDALRDVHWKSVARRVEDDLVVKEFVADETVGSTAIAVDATTASDEVAAAAASVASYLLERDVAVGLVTSDGSLPAGSGERHRREILRTLALVGAGSLADDDRREADLVVRADASGVVVDVGERAIPFDRLRGDVIDAGRARAGDGASEVAV